MDPPPQEVTRFSNGKELTRLPSLQRVMPSLEEVCEEHPSCITQAEPCTEKTGKSLTNSEAVDNVAQAETEGSTGNQVTSMENSDAEDSSSKAPPTSPKTTNQLQSVPDYFLSSSTSSDSASNKEIPQKDTKDSNNKKPVNRSLDLLKVDAVTERASSMPPLSNSEDGSEVSEANTKSISNSSSEENLKAALPAARAFKNKIFGRFSSAEELLAREERGEDLEAKFVLLTSAFSTDKLTLEKRLEISQHTRTSVEESLRNEVNSLLEVLKSLIVRDIHHLIKEELRDLEKRLQNLVPVAIKLGCKAETYGAVRQEQSLSQSADAMVAYVEHLKRLNTQEANDHQATRMRLLQAQREWNMVDSGDNVNVNITRRSSTVGGITQTIGRRRASVAITALPNLIGSSGLRHLSVFQKSLSSSLLTPPQPTLLPPGGLNNNHSSDEDDMDPKTRFQQLVRKTSKSHGVKVSGSEDDESYTELPAVTISKPDSAPKSAPTSPATASPIPPPLVVTPAQRDEDNNNGSNSGSNKVHVLDDSHIAVIKTITAIKPCIQTIEKPEEGKVRTAIRRKRSIKRSDTVSSSRPSIHMLDHSPSAESNPICHMAQEEESALEKFFDDKLSHFETYRSMKEKYENFNEAFPAWKRRFNQIIFVLFILLLYLQINHIFT